MFIRFIKPIWDKLQAESKRTGKSIPTIIQEVLAQHYNI